MAGAIGKAFKISGSEARGYGYVDAPGKRSYRRNAGVTAIAAINGPGAYARSRSRKPSARKAMSGLSQNQRRKRAAQLTKAEREAFAGQLRQAKRRKADSMILSRNAARGASKKKPTRTKRRVEQGRINIKRAQEARRRWGAKVEPGRNIRVGPKFQAKLGKGRKIPKAKKLPPGLYSANRRRRSDTRRESMITARGRRRPVRRATGLRRNRQTPAQRRASLRNLRKARAALRPNRTSRPRIRTIRRPKASRRPSRAKVRSIASRARRRAQSTVTRKRQARKSMSRNRKQTPAQRRASLRNLAKARRARRSYSKNWGLRSMSRGVKRAARRTRRAASRAGPSLRRKVRLGRSKSRRSYRRNSKQTPAQRRASLRNLAKARRARRAMGYKANRRRKGYRKNWGLRSMSRGVKRAARRTGRSVRRRTRRASRGTKRTYRRHFGAPKRRFSRNRRQTAAQRRASMRNLRKAWSKSRGRKRMTSNRRRRSGKGRRRLARNRRRPGLFGRLFRKNQSATATLQDALKSGVVLTAGFTAHKALTHLVSKLLVEKLAGTAAAPVVPAAEEPTMVPTVEPAPAAGLGQLAEYSDLISGTLTAIVGIIAVQKLVKTEQTRLLLAGGMATSLLHTALVTVLNNIGQTQAAAALSGDATAARLSAMYGMGALPAASIQPMYAPAAGLGQPIYQAAAGMGQPIYQAAAGMGEYFESGVEGLGNYTGNPEIMQAAAGFGQAPEIDGPHIDPSSDLDRELSIAEAAAGVGEYFESGVQGLGEFYGPQGTIGRSSTWIPGQSDPSIWAGVRPVSRPQEATALTTAGVLQSGGGSGILG